MWSRFHDWVYWTLLHNYNQLITIVRNSPGHDPFSSLYSQLFLGSEFAQTQPKPFCIAIENCLPRRRLAMDSLLLSRAEAESCLASCCLAKIMFLYCCWNGNSIVACLMTAFLAQQFNTSSKSVTIYIATHMTIARQRHGKHSTGVTLSTIEGHSLLRNGPTNTHSRIREWKYFVGSVPRNDKRVELRSQRLRSSVVHEESQ
jgi:hypothetical protein